ncbi:MAG TPA: prolipoprotein diacylglyceryl transferase family protein, partial [Pirellulales bacterium]|nr:prolipoprotein diacylglyceryl transferase family protein [Pirellulales bacterium]
FWLFLSGIVGARLFFIVEYWPQFQRSIWLETAQELINFTKGGLVVFGAAIGAGLALAAFVRKHRVPGLALADLSSPSVMLGLALGRMGCFLNGCCFGGECELPWKVQFPFASPPHVQQVEQRKLYLHGLEFSYARPKSAPIIASVQPGSAAERAGLAAGQRIVAIKNKRGERVAVDTTDDAIRQLFSIFGEGARLEIYTSGDRSAKVVVLGAPQASLPVHPAQLYSAIDALLLCLFLLAYYPYRRRDGEVFALMVTIHPVARFLQEIIRTDESAVFGTGLSISQNISLLMLVGAAGLWLYLTRRPRNVVWPLHATVQ